MDRLPGLLTCPVTKHCHFWEFKVLAFALPLFFLASRVLGWAFIDFHWTLRFSEVLGWQFMVTAFAFLTPRVLG
jgi:hypothetical protein